MARQRGAVPVGIGAVSILAVFVLLSLTTLGALSLVSARADQRLSERTAQAATAYYQADGRAEERLAEALDLARAGGDWTAALEATGYACAPTDAGVQVTYQEPISDISDLEVILLFQTDGNGNFTGQWQRLTWRSALNEAAADPEEAPLKLLH